MLTEKLADYFNLGFDTPSSPDIPLKLGKRQTRHRISILQELACWLLLTCGIFLRKALMLVDLNWVDASLTPELFSAPPSSRSLSSLRSCDGSSAPVRGQVLRALPQPLPLASF